MGVPELGSVEQVRDAVGVEVLERAALERPASVHKELSLYTKS
jgi:hypothetical protein